MENNAVAIAISGLSFMMTVIWGDPLIRFLKTWRIGKIIREDGPDQHTVKMGTPTMGGIMILIPITLLTLLFNAVSILGFNFLGRSVLLPLVTMWAFAVLGAIDDWEGVRGARRGSGMRAITKFAIQVALAIAIAFALRDILLVPQLIWFTAEEALNLGPFCWNVQRSEFHGRLGWSGGVDICHGLRGFWIRSSARRTGFLSSILFFPRWRSVRFSMVQCSSSQPFYGGYRVLIPGSNPGCGRLNDRPVAASSSYRSHPCQ